MLYDMFSACQNGDQNLCSKPLNLLLPGSRSAVEFSTVSALLPVSIAAKCLLSRRF